MKNNLKNKEMKKMIFPAIFLCASVNFAVANKLTDEIQTATAAVVESTNEQVAYQEVSISSLSETLQQAIQTLAGETFEIQKIEADATQEKTKVSLINKETKEAKVVILNKEGVEVV